MNTMYTRGIAPGQNADSIVIFQLKRECSGPSRWPRHVRRSLGVGERGRVSLKLYTAFDSSVAFQAMQETAAKNRVLYLGRISLPSNVR